MPGDIFPATAAALLQAKVESCALLPYALYPYTHTAWPGNNTTTTPAFPSNTVHSRLKDTTPYTLGNEGEGKKRELENEAFLSIYLFFRGKQRRTFLVYVLAGWRMGEKG